MNIEAGLFFFLTFCYIITLISDIIDHHFITENVLQSWEEITSLEQYTFKFMKTLRAASLGANFTESC